MVKTIPLGEVHHSPCPRQPRLSLKIFGANTNYSFVVVDLDKSENYPDNFFCTLPVSFTKNGTKFLEEFGLEKAREIAKKLLEDALIEFKEKPDISSEIEKRLEQLSPKPKPKRTCRKCGTEFEPIHNNHFFCQNCKKQRFNGPDKMLKKCPTCQMSFLGDSRQIYCSTECQTKRYRRIYEQIECVRCGESFTPRMSHQTHCSNCVGKSRTKVSPEERECSYCGETFMPNSPKQIYCSTLCKHRHFRMVEKEEKIEEILEKRKCAVCKKKFMPNRRDQIYCSKKCNVRAYYERNFKAVQKNPVKCSVCGKKFTPNNLAHGSLYCSESCKKRAYYLRKKAKQK